jgi:hypothetical protein
VRPEAIGPDLPPPLPPSPMGTEQAVRGFREVPLPWSLLLLAVLVALPSGLVGMLRQGGAHFASPGYVATYMSIGVANTVLTVLGAAILDRLCPRSPRSLRWMIGMALHGFIPLGLVFSLWSMMYGQLAAALFTVLLQMAYGVVSGAVTGLALGLAAERSERLHLRLASAGFIAGVARTAVYAPALLASMAAYGSPLRSVAASHWGGLALAQCVFGVLLGLAIAACLSSARRAEAPLDADW